MNAIIMHEHPLIIKQYDDNNKYEKKDTYYELDSLNLLFEKKYKIICNKCEIYNKNLFYGININYESKNYEVLYPDFKEDYDNIILGNDKEKIKYFFNLYVNILNNNENKIDENEYLKDIENLKQENEKLKVFYDENKNLKNKNKNLNNEINKQKKEIQNLKNKNKNLNDEINNLKKEIQNLKDKNKNLNNEINNQKKEIQNIEYENLLKEYSKIMNENDNLKLYIDILKKKNKNENLFDENQNNFRFKYLNDDYNGFYDIIIDINSLVNLNKEGWIINYSNEENREFYNKKKNIPTITIGVIGNGNKGKSFFLEKLSDYNLPKGFNVKTKGLSIRYAVKDDHNLTILDSAGQETPLLNNDNYQINKSDFEYYSKDKINTEFFIQKFIILKSNILFIIVGNITLSEQKLITRIKNEGKNKQIYIIHNLQIFQTKEQVDDYIENTLKKLYNNKIKECIFQNFTGNNNKNLYNKFFIEEEEHKIITHLILINDYCENSEYYNLSTINFIKKELEVVKDRQNFPVIEECKKFLYQFSQKNFEESIVNEDSIELKYINKNTDKIVINNLKEIKLKKLIIDEIGNTIIYNGIIPDYSYYILDDYLYINIELASGGVINNIKYINKLNCYLFTINGKKKGEEKIGEKTNIIEYKHSTRKSYDFNLYIEIPNNSIIIEGLYDTKFDKGVITYIYNIKKIENIEFETNSF